MHRPRSTRRARAGLSLLLAGVFLGLPLAFTPARAHGQESVAQTKGRTAEERITEEKITVSFRETAIEEVYEMLSREGRVNILLGRGVSGPVSANLYEVTLEQAIHAIAEATGYVVERRNGTYVVVEREEAGRDAIGGNTVVRAFRLRYSDPEDIEEALNKHLSRYGKLTILPDRNMIVIEDQPGFVRRIEDILSEIDVQPQQILIEAKILEITLDADETFGIDWSRAFDTLNGELELGTTGLAPRGLPGLFLDVMSPELELFLSALSSQGRVRTLSTPKLLVLENQEAEVIVGDRVGFRVTTTINQVTTESVEFLDSGVILRVEASVDRKGRVLLQVHPEVSTATLNDGIPSLATTEVTTQLVAEDGQKIFIGGLIKNQSTEDRTGVPILSDLPILGRVFTRTEEVDINTETVVVITPHIMERKRRAISMENAAKISAIEKALERKYRRIEKKLPKDQSSSEDDDDSSGSHSDSSHSWPIPDERTDNWR